MQNNIYSESQHMWVWMSWQPGSGTHSVIKSLLELQTHCQLSFGTEVIFTEKRPMDIFQPFFTQNTCRSFTLPLLSAFGRNRGAVDLLLLAASNLTSPWTAEIQVKHQSRWARWAAPAERHEESNSGFTDPSSCTQWKLCFVQGMF